MTLTATKFLFLYMLKMILKREGSNLVNDIMFDSGVEEFHCWRH